MSKYCPILKQNVVYLVCEDCDQKGRCTGKKTGKTESLSNCSNKNPRRK